MYYVNKLKYFYLYPLEIYNKCKIHCWDGPYHYRYYCKRYRKGVLVSLHKQISTFKRQLWIVLADEVSLVSDD